MNFIMKFKVFKAILKRKEKFEMSRLTHPKFNSLIKCKISLES